MKIETVKPRVCTKHMLWKWEQSSKSQVNVVTGPGYTQDSGSHSQVWKCVSTTVTASRSLRWVTSERERFPLTHDCRGLHSRLVLCFGLVLRPEIMARSVWRTTAALTIVANDDREKRPRSTTSGLCLPWPLFLPLGCIFYRPHHFSKATTDQQPKC